MSLKWVPAWEQQQVGEDAVLVTLNWKPGAEHVERTIRWLEAHGIKEWIPEHTWFLIHREAKQICYLGFVFDDAGRVLLADEDGQPVPYGQEKDRAVTGRCATRLCVVQLQRTPEPWPEPAPVDLQRTDQPGDYRQKENDHG